MPKLTEEQKEKGKSFVKTLGDIAWNSTALVIVLIIVAILLFSLIGFFVFFSVAGEAEEDYQAEVQERTYGGIEYQPSEGDPIYDGEYYVDLADLGVEQLGYTHTGWGFHNGLSYSQREITLSTIDDLKTPTTVYTLHYDVWAGQKSTTIDKKEAKLKKAYDGEVAVAELDYGAAEACWLGDELLLRYGDKYLILFYSDTTRELLNSQVCADFMRTQMQLPEIEEETVFDYFFLIK